MMLTLEKRMIFILACYLNKPKRVGKVKVLEHCCQGADNNIDKDIDLNKLRFRAAGKSCQDTAFIATCASLLALNPFCATWLLGRELTSMDSSTGAR